MRRTAMSGGIAFTLRAEMLGLQDVACGAVAVCQARLQNGRGGMGCSSRVAGGEDVFL